MASVLGISAYYHDSAAALVQDGQIVAAVQEERFSRLKHDHRFPAESVRYCLEAGGITAADLDAVVFYDKPLLKFERLLETYLAFAPSGLRSFVQAMNVWLSEKLFIPREIDKGLGGGYTGPIYFAGHHESHAASAFYPSPFAEAAVLTIDGVGEWATTAWGRGSGSSVELCEQLEFPHSLGLLYSAFTYYLGFRVNSGEYKAMGLAPYGKPRYAQAILDDLLDLKDDGSFWLNQRYFNYCAGLTMTNERFHRLFGGPPRSPESPLAQRHMDIAASIQHVTEEVMLRLARHVHSQTGLPNLCLAGGVALNCVANGRILREGPFARLWIQPAAGDAGGALGAALLGWHRILGNPREPVEPDRQSGSYLGPAPDPAAVPALLDELGARYARFDDEQALCRAVAELLDDGRVVGHVAGRMEFGPRALGHRSILGDPRDPATQSTMNRKIKFRESFRPFAPSCLEERADDYFGLGVSSPYMLLVAPVREERRVPLAPSEQDLLGIELLNAARSEIPAVTHVDYSARVQTVGPAGSPRFRKLLEAFEERTGCPVLVNTSFNIRGEPIVCTPEEAYRCFMFTDMDALVVENCLLLKADQTELPGAREYREQFAPD